MLTFDDERHEYRWNGLVVPGVTSVIEHTLKSFEGVPRRYLVPAQERGTFVHRATELFDLGELDESELQEEQYGGYLRAWKGFCEATEPNWIAIEEMDYSRLFGFAGTLDRRGYLPKYKR